jgi:competence protein ComEA
MGDREVWKKILTEYKWSLGIGLIGLSLIGAGLANYFTSKEEILVEIIPGEEERATSVWVDIEGAVEKPGVYELGADSRVNDLLIKAQGLAANADRGWVEKNINLAQKLSDGVKIYIPRKGEATQLHTGTGGIVAGSLITSQININTASASELDSLWGIGEKRAEAIISNRPYQSIEDLKTKKIVPSNVYERIENQITVY